MIERILDKYFAKKCIEETEHFILINYNLDFKVEHTDNKHFIYVKKRKYKDYTNVGTIYNSKAVLTLINLEDYWKLLTKNIERYLEDEQ